ncbi:MAG: ECF-type sigma factor, partial [Thermoanaerobaculia bacterium]
DFTQAYFTELLDKDFLADVDPSKGRFRAFLLASLRHFLSHQRDRARALKRGGGTPTLSLDVAAGEESYTLQPSDEMTPEDVFEHRWALTVLDRAMGRLQLESAESDDLTQFDKLKPYLTSAEPQATYQESAADLGMSVRAIKTAVHRLRKRYGMCLRAEIAQTVANPADTDEEVRHLLATVRP